LQKQAVKLKSDAILTEGGSKDIKNLDKLIKEMQMSRKRMNNNVFDFLFEMAEETNEGGYPTMEADEADEADEKLKEADEKAEDAEPDVDAAVEALEKALAALKGEDAGDE
jgi:hypothetical protein